MNTPKKRTERSGFWKHKHIPRAAKYLDTAIAIVLLALSIYHFTQPNQAWRSGVTEIVFAAVLIAAAYLLPDLLAAAANIAGAIGTISLGIRHVIHGSGWRSGIAELAFTVILVILAVMIYRNRGK
jgi:membrane-bound ClpP family serine protease